MRNTKVLLIGFKGLNSEVCKNLVLAGVHSVTILEHENAKYSDLSAHLFLSEKDVGKNVLNRIHFNNISKRGEASVERISNLNPLVEIHADRDELIKKDTNYFKNFNVICASNCSIQSLVNLIHI